MKIFRWMQNKLNGKERKNTLNSASATGHVMNHACKEEFSDWPNGLFAIGTFGNSILKHTEDTNFQTSIAFCHDQQKNNLQMEKQVDCLPSLEHITSDELVANKDSRVQLTTSEIQSRESDVRLHCAANGIGRKSLSYLLKKALLCGGGFNPTPILRDPFPEAKLDKSRLEKVGTQNFKNASKTNSCKCKIRSLLILGAILQKKIYPQNSTQLAAAKKYLDMPESDSGNDGSKWVKTDSEYIVLEI